MLPNSIILGPWARFIKKLLCLILHWCFLVLCFPQLSLKNTHLSHNKYKIKDLEQDMDVYESERVVDGMRQSQKWQEFESLADDMKSLSR